MVMLGFPNIRGPLRGIPTISSSHMLGLCHSETPVSENDLVLFACKMSSMFCQTCALINFKR